MKLEILRKRNALEIHQTNEDDSITVWVCESDQAAMFKLASIIFSQEEKPERSKRSILVGTFTKKSEPKPLDLDDSARKIAEEFLKNGYGLKVGANTKFMPLDEGQLFTCAPDTKVQLPTHYEGHKKLTPSSINEILHLLEQQQTLEFSEKSGCFGLVDSPVNFHELANYTSTYQGSKVNVYHTTITSSAQE